MLHVATVAVITAIETRDPSNKFLLSQVSIAKLQAIVEGGKKH